MQATSEGSFSSGTRTGAFSAFVCLPKMLAALHLRRKIEIQFPSRMFISESRFSIFHYFPIKGFQDLRKSRQSRVFLSYIVSLLASSRSEQRGKCYPSKDARPSPQAY